MPLPSADPGPPTADRLPAIDWLKCMAIVAVILTHTGLAVFPGTPGYTRWDALLRHLLPAFHVPCLLMISGFLYYRPHPIGWPAVRTRLERILLPYLIASVVIFVVLPAPAPTFGDRLREMTVALLGANALPIYYYVFLLTLFVAMTPLFSRLSLRVLQGIVALTFLALGAMCFIPQLRLSIDFFWSMRNPVESFTLGYFLLGWISAARSPEGPPWTPVRDIPVLVAAFTIWPLCAAMGSPYPAILVAKIPYAFAVWKLSWRFLNTGTVPELIRRISESSYGIFLYHYILIEAFRFRTVGWSPPLRIATLTAIGLGGSMLLGVFLRRLAGPRRARRLFGY